MGLFRKRSVSQGHTPHNTPEASPLVVVGSSPEAVESAVLQQLVPSKLTRAEKEAESRRLSLEWEVPEPIEGASSYIKLDVIYPDSPAATFRMKTHQDVVLLPFMQVESFVRTSSDFYGRSLVKARTTTGNEYPVAEYGLGGMQAFPLHGVFPNYHKTSEYYQVAERRYQRYIDPSEVELERIMELWARWKETFPDMNCA